MHTSIAYRVFCSNLPLTRFTYRRWSLKLHRKRTNSSPAQADDIQHIFKIFGNSFLEPILQVLLIPSRYHRKTATFPKAELTLCLYRIALEFLRGSFCLSFFRNWLKIILEKFRQDYGRRDPCNCLCRTEHSPSALCNSENSIKGNHTIPFPEWPCSILNWVKALKSILQPILQ